MNKLKEVFSHDSDKSSNSMQTPATSARAGGVTSGTFPTSSSTPAQESTTGATSGLAGSAAAAAAPRTSTASSTSTGPTGAMGVDRNTRDHIIEKPSLPNHQHNVEKRHDLPKDGEGVQTHDHKHLAAVTHERHHTHETEEVERIREHDRHVHHVQHHVQPVLDTQHRDREHTETHVPVTHIKESHTNTPEDLKLFASHGAKHVDSQHTGTTDRTVVDKGEIVKENVQHHVHHVVQPVIERDTHHHKTIHTTIPVKHTTHEAPIIHQSADHAPMSMKDFVGQGGDLKSKLTHDQAGVLAGGDCERTVDGPAEELARKLHLGSSHGSSQPTSGTLAK